MNKVRTVFAGLAQISAFQLLPLIAFLVVSNVWHHWPAAFFVGSLFSVMLIVLYWMKFLHFKPIALAFNFFVLGGAAMFIFNIGWLQQLYSYLQPTAYFLSIFITGISLTLCSQRGFIDIESEDHARVIKYSLLLLSVTALALICSWFFKSYSYFSTTLPMLLILLAHDLLRTYFKDNTASKFPVIMIVFFLSTGLSFGLRLFIGTSTGMGLIAAIVARTLLKSKLKAS